jgi:hypothetical protein
VHDAEGQVASLDAALQDAADRRSDAMAPQGAWVRNGADGHVQRDVAAEGRAHAVAHSGAWLAAGIAAEPPRGLAPGARALAAMRTEAQAGLTLAPTRHLD